MTEASQRRGPGSCSRRFAEAVPKTVRHRVHVSLVDSPVLRAAYLGCRPQLRCLAPNRRTALVLEGFPRSANTYALAALYDANPDLRGLVAHHLHSCRSVIEGVQRGLPVVVLVRAPLEAVASLIQRYPDLAAALALRQYVSFHRKVLPVLPSVVIATFEQAVTRFDTVVAEINERFNLRLAPYVGSAESEDRVRRAVELMDLEDGGQLAVREATVARPSSVRLAARDAPRECVRGHAHLLQQAEATYELVMDARGARPAVDKVPQGAA